MCLFYMCEPMLGDQDGGGPAIQQNQHRDRLGLGAIWSLPFRSSSLSAILLGFSLFPLVYVVLVVFISMQPHSQVCSLCLFLCKH